MMMIQWRPVHRAVPANASGWLFHGVGLIRQHGAMRLLVRHVSVYIQWRPRTREEWEDVYGA